MKKIGCIVLVMILLTSCNFVYNKSSYVDAFESFVETIEKKKEIAEDQWEEFDAEFEKFSVEYYEKYSDELSKEEQKRIGQLKARYVKTVAKKKFGGFMEKMEKASDQVGGFLDEILK